MAGFTKLFSDIIDSTVWREDLATKVVWVTMLAKADKNGIVRSSIPGLADAARVSLPECLEALAKFLGPDAYSRTKDFEGRRIMETDGGWILLNYQKYRKLKDEEETRIATAERVKKFREKHNVTKVTDVTPSNAIAEAEAEALKITPLPPKGTKRKGRAKTEPIPGDLLPKLEQLCSEWPASFLGTKGERVPLRKWTHPEDLWEHFRTVWPDDDPYEMAECGLKHLNVEDTQTSGWDFAGVETKTQFTYSMKNFYGVKDKFWRLFR